MTRRTAAHVLLVASLIAVAIFAGSGSRSAVPALAETTTTITFDDLAAGTVVSNQYDSQGVDFEKGIIGQGVYCYPVITQVASADAESGDQVADTSCANGEFPNSSIWGVLKNSAQNLSVYAGFFPNYANPPSSENVTLTAYDADGNVVGTDTESVPTLQGAHTLLQIAGASANIDQFSIAANNSMVFIDNLTFDNPAGVPPDFRIRSEIYAVAVAQGLSDSTVIDVNRLNGSSGGVEFSASGLPTGVHALFTPNPATGASTTMTLTADNNAPLITTYPYPTFTVTGTPDSSAVGPAPQSISEGVDVFPPFTISVPSAVQVPPCSTVQVPVEVTWSLDPITFKQPFTGPVTLTASGVPSDDQASWEGAFDSIQLQPESGTNYAKTTLTFTGGTDQSGPSTTTTVLGSDDDPYSGLLQNSGSFTVSRVPTSITSFSPTGGTPAYAGRDESVVDVKGAGFCPGTTVDFGNALASAPTQTTGPGDHSTEMQFLVPRLATSGPLYAMEPGTTFATAPQSASSFTVDNYRDTDGFAFENSDTFQNNVGGYSFSDVSAVFGDAQTHLSANPCWPFGDCSIVTPIPDPFALLFWGIADASLQGGQCFGFGLASQRLMHGDESIESYPLQPGAGTYNVWNLQGPDAAGGPSSQIAHFIHLMHMEQLSAQGLHAWLTSAAYNAVSGSQSSIVDDVLGPLQNGDHPLIELRNGTEGHVVVAYDVEDGSNGDKLIDVYDPNQEFTTYENNEDLARDPGDFHQYVLDSSQITVHSDGHWVFPGAFSDSPWHGGPGSLVVVPYGTIPVQPTLPDSLSGLFDLIFGSARASQVTDAAGHTLLNPDGSVNTSKTGIPDATQFATLSGSTKPGPDVFLFGKAGEYTQTIAGNGTGQYHDALMGHGMEASVTVASHAGLVDKVGVLPNLAGVQFGQVSATKATGARQVKAQILIHASDGTERTATIGTTMATAGADSVGFNSSGNSLTVRAGGKPVTYSLTLSWAGPHGLPQTFVTPKETIGAAATASLTPASWSSLQNTSLDMKVKDKNGTTRTSKVSNQMRPAARFTMSLATTKGKLHVRKLSIAAKFKRLVKGSSALLTWVVLKGATVQAHRGFPVPAGTLHLGLLKRTFKFKAVAGTGYTAEASVAVFSPTKSGSVLSQVVAKKKGFQG